MHDITFNNDRILLGMSGGVDSAAAVLLLLEDGYEVIGCTCLFCRDDDSNADAVASARAVCEQFRIEHVVHDARPSFKNEVVVPFCNGYETGSTPSPCVVCNEKMKLPALASVADTRGCHWIATGHYAQVGSKNAPDGGETFFVSRHRSPAKDQSYMLSRLPQEILSRLVLPLSEIHDKEEVRALVSSAGLSCASKADSQDICFAPDGYKKLMDDMGYSMGRPGDIVDAAGKILGRHNGLPNYTIGQRRGIGVSCPVSPFYVIGKNMDANELIVGFRDDLMTKCFAVGSVVRQKDSVSRNLTCQIRYHMGPVDCSISALGDGQMMVTTKTPIARPASGQYCVVYDGDDVVACGEIV